jgi:DNA repair protein RecO (recombination protein O)
MEWEAPAIVLAVRPFNEADAIAAVFTEAHGVYRGLVRGGASRRLAAVWQAGNLVQARWAARLSEQLGGLTGELVHAAAAEAMEDALTLAVLSAACAIADGGLPERQAHPRIFSGLLSLIARLNAADGMLLADYTRWELALLADLGFGLDLTACAVTGATAGLAFVSPRSGRAVSASGAGDWAAKLLPLPGFLTGGNLLDAEAFQAALRLTGHFLARDAFGHRHLPLPQARLRLSDRVDAMAAAQASPTPD